MNRVFVYWDNSNSASRRNVTRVPTPVIVFAYTSKTSSAWRMPTDRSNEPSPLVPYRRKCGSYGTGWKAAV